MVAARKLSPNSIAFNYVGNKAPCVCLSRGLSQLAHEVSLHQVCTFVVVLSLPALTPAWAPPTLDSWPSLGLFGIQCLTTPHSGDVLQTWSQEAKGQDEPDSQT